MYAEPEQYLMAYIQDNFDDLPVRYPNKDFDPFVDGVDGWIWPTVQFGEAIQETIVGRNDSCGQLVQGLLLISVFSPREIGDGLCRSTCDLLSSMFNRLVIDMTSISRKLVMGVPQKPGSGDESDSWFQQNLAIPFHYHT
jgi:hypothetical protein